MRLVNRSSCKRRAALAAALLLASATAEATVVRYSTSLGDIDVRLFDSATPLSVQNLLSYVTDGDYTDSFIHRSMPGFVIQGGGFRWPEGGGLGEVPADSPVLNEPGISNVRGTVAYAKFPGDPNSATSEWFFNLADNSSNLDFQNGGFTAFGRVLGAGMDVVDLIASQQVVPAGSFQTLPVLDSFDGDTVYRQDLVFVNSVTVLNNPDGDYNFDGTVDAADYVVWRDTVGSTTNVEADGDGSGQVDAADYQLWRTNFGAVAASLTAGGSAAPEPAAAGLAALGVAAVVARRPRRA